MATVETVIKTLAFSFTHSFWGLLLIKLNEFQYHLFPQVFHISSLLYTGKLEHIS